MGFQHHSRMGVMGERASHPPAVAHTAQQPPDVIDHLDVRVEVSERLMEPGDSGDLPGEVPVEEVPVAGAAEQPWADGRVVESAEGFDDVDAPPARDALGEPEQRLDASRQPLEGVRRQWSELMGQQSDRLDQRDVVGRSRGGQQGEPHGDRAAIGPLPDEPTPRPADAFRVRPHGRRGEVFVRVHRDVDVVERVGQLAGRCGGPCEVRVQDECRVLADQGPVVRRHQAPSAMRRFIGERLPVPWERLLRGQPVQPERVVEQFRR